MAKKDPAFLLYSKDWLQGTSELMPEEKGVYIDLLCHQHQSGDLPSDTRRLAKIAGIGHDDFLRIWEALKCKFEPTALPNGEPNGDRIGNRKLYQVMGERAENAKKNKVNGVFAAALRALKLSKKDYSFIKSAFNSEDFLSMADELTTEWLTEWCTERLTERSKSIEDVDEDVDEDIQDDNTLKGGAGGKHDFDVFWKAYDKKIGDKVKLAKKWDALDLETQNIILEYIPQYKAATPDKSYRKNPETFLNNKSWNDEIISKGKKHDDISADKYKNMTVENYWNV